MATKTLGKLKAEVSFNRDLTNLVDVMKSIAASQYQVMDKKKLDLTRYKKAVEELFTAYDFRASAHPFIRMRNQKKVICLVTTDFGFLGGLNMKVMNAALKQETEQAHYLVLGDRGANQLRDFGKSFTQLPGINPDESRYELAVKLQTEIFRLVLKEGYGQVMIVSPYSLSMGSQKIQVMNLIPCPMFFKYREGGVLTKEDQAPHFILESPEKNLIESLTSYWLSYRFIEIFESAKLAEYGARMMHLEDSFMTLSKIDKQLKLEYFKLRREKIDQSLRETATAVLILKN